MSIFFFDIDGTTMDSDGNIPTSTVYAIQQLRRQGHICLINTGRPPFDVEQSLRDIGFDGYVCTCGQHIFLNGHEVYHDGFTPEESKIIFQKVRDCRISGYYESPCVAYSDYVVTLAPDIQAAVDRLERKGIPPIPIADDVSFQFDKLAVSVTSDSNTDEFLTWISHYCELIDRGRRMYELPKLGHSKATGCAMATKHFNIPQTDSYAIGDSTNDLPMLYWSAHPIVMGNASPNVLQVAEYIAPPLEDDGLYRILVALGLIPPSSRFSK